MLCASYVRMCRYLRGGRLTPCCTCLLIGSCRTSLRRHRLWSVGILIPNRSVLSLEYGTFSLFWCPSGTWGLLFGYFSHGSLTPISSNASSQSSANSCHAWRVSSFRLSCFIIFLMPFRDLGFNSSLLLIWILLRLMPGRLRSLSLLEFCLFPSLHPGTLPILRRSGKGIHLLFEVWLSFPSYFYCPSGTWGLLS